MEGHTGSKTMRCSDADRDRVAEVLREAAAEGRITLVELEERLELVYQARTYADLEPVTADLPEAGRAPAPALARPHVPEREAPPLEITEKMGHVRRQGAWRVPAKVVVTNPYGHTLLDFRTAVFTSRVVEVKVDTSWGHARFWLPEGATAELDVTSSWGGSVDSRVGETPSPDHPHLQIVGQAKGGWLHVRGKKKGWSSWLGDDEDWDWG